MAAQTETRVPVRLNSRTCRAEKRRTAEKLVGCSAQGMIPERHADAVNLTYRVMRSVTKHTYALFCNGLDRTCSAYGQIMFCCSYAGMRRGDAKDANYYYDKSYRNIFVHNNSNVHSLNAGGAALMPDHFVKISWTSLTPTNQQLPPTPS